MNEETADTVRQWLSKAESDWKTVSLLSTHADCHARERGSNSNLSIDGREPAPWPPEKGAANDSEEGSPPLIRGAMSRQAGKLIMSMFS